ncbi:TPA: phage tail tip fiber protein [Salmonella enterica subsp. enterica serovar Muenchen]
MLKVQKTKDGVPYVAGIGAGIEDVDGQTLSQILLAANRTEIIDPSNGNTVPMLVAQGGQIFLNEVLTKSLSINGRFIVTPDGIMTATGAHITGEIDADSGTLNNVTVNENCTIKGTVDAGNILGDVYFRSLFYLNKVVYDATHPDNSGGDRDNQWIPFLGIAGENFDRYLDTDLTVTFHYDSNMIVAVRYELSIGADDAGGGISTVWTSGAQGPGDLRNKSWTITGQVGRFFLPRKGRGGNQQLYVKQRWAGVIFDGLGGSSRHVTITCQANGGTLFRTGAEKVWVL